MSNKLFKNLKGSLEEVLAFKKGKLDLRSELIEIPEPPVKYKAKEIKKIRERYHYSQGLLAKMLNMSIKTVQSWESGQRSPSHGSLRLLELIDKGIYHPEIHKKRI